MRAELHAKSKFFPNSTQKRFALVRVRMRRAEDPTSPLDHVQHDGLGFEHVVAGCGRVTAERLGKPFPDSHDYMVIAVC